MTTGLAGVLRVLVAILLLNLLPGVPVEAATAQPPSTPVAAPVGDERRTSQLNVSIVVFDPGVPTDPSSHRRLQVFPRIREVEALFLPFVLRETLVESNEWGAVRVVPERDSAAELLVSGTIVRSDGEMLELQLNAIDASGRVWVNKAYAGRGASGNGQSTTMPGTPGYQKLYAEIAEDLRIARADLDEKALSDIIQVSWLRYANQLVPAAFGDYLDNAPDGTFKIQRLPAENDPMLERIERIRRLEYVVTDTVDEQFQQLHTEIASTYDLWRKYRRQLAEYRHKEDLRLKNSRSSAPRGSYEAIKKRYDNYKWSRIGEQDQKGWAEGFNNEVGPTVAELESHVARLKSLVEQQYAEWGRILAEIFSVETGLDE